MAGSEFLDFLGQMPPMLYFCMCFSVIWLVLSVAAVFYSRSRRKQQAIAASSTSTTGGSTAMKFNAEPPKPQKNFDTGELPDLDVLLNMPAAPQVAASRPAIPGTYAVKLADGENVQAVEVMVIMRDVDDGKLLVQLGDNAYSNLSNDPDTKARFLKIMKELAQIVSASPTTSNAPASPPQSYLTPTPDVLRAELTSEPDEIPSISDLFQQEIPLPATPKPPPPLPDGTIPGDLPKFKLEEQPLVPRRGIGLMRMSKDDKDRLKKPIQDVNIAQAIEEYLQYKLRHTPEYAGRSLHVSPAPGGGVTIEVDGKFYEAVGDIPNENVRAFIAATIQEWQERQ